MALIQVQAPVVLPVSLEEMKQHIHVDHANEDARILDFIKAATAKLDGRDGLLGRGLMTQRWRLTLDGFPSEIVVPLPPLQEISVISYLDTNGDAQTLAPADYQVVGLGGGDRACIRPAFGQSWPATRGQAESVTVDFVAGYGETADSPPVPAVPEPVRTAIMMHVGHLYEHRESVMVLAGFVGATPQGYDELIADYRIWSF